MLVFNVMGFIDNNKTKLSQKLMYGMTASYLFAYRLISELTYSVFNTAECLLCLLSENRTSACGAIMATLFLSSSGLSGKALDMSLDNLLNLATLPSDYMIEIVCANSF